jgi:hypothetical protein
MSDWLENEVVDIGSLDVVHVYPQPDQHRTFDMQDTDVIDEILDIAILNEL